MRSAIPASVGLHFGLAIAAWLVTQAPPVVDEMSAESVSVDILSVESFVTLSASEVATEATETLVSSGAEAAMLSESEPVKAVATETIERAKVAPPKLAPAVSALAVEAEALVSAEVLTASIDSMSTPVAAALAQAIDPATALVADTAQPAEPLPTELAPATPAEVLEAKPVEVAALAPPVAVTAEVVPIPRPRIVRKPVETNAEAKPVEQPVEKPVKKAAEKPATPSVAGNGGKAEADSAAVAASGGKGKSSDGGSAAVGKYPGLVQSKVTRAARYPSKARGARGEAEVRFTLDAGGRVLKLALTRSSGNAEIDAAALAAVERAAPLPPIPEGAGRSSWSFTVPLRFRK